MLYNCKTVKNVDTIVLRQSQNVEIRLFERKTIVSDKNINSLLFGGLDKTSGPYDVANE